MYSIDFVTAYLNGRIEEEIYMEQPEGFKENTAVDEEGNTITGDLVCLLVKALYGLKQAGRAWNEALTKALDALGFIQLVSEPCIFKLIQPEGPIYIGLYVDDMTCVTATKDQYKWLYDAISKVFPITDKGELTHMLGVRLTRNRSDRTITIDQEVYISALLTKHQITDRRGASTPMETNAVNTLALAQGENVDSLNEKTGELLYLARVSRPDIAFAVALLCKYNMQAKAVHHVAAERILRYLMKTSKLKLVLGGPDSKINAYTDADHAGDPADRISVTGYLFTWGGAISWSSKKQQSQANSTTESEYYALGMTNREYLWIMQLLKELEVQQEQPAIVWCDNQGCVNIAKNPVEHGKMKHIDIAYHLSRQLVKKGVITVKYLPTAEMLADGFTKPLPKPGILKLREGCGLRIIE